MKQIDGWKPGARLSAAGALLALVLTSGCATTMAGGTDAGCVSYAEQRLAMPRAEPIPGGPWGGWIADTDDRMTGACR